MDDESPLARYRRHTFISDELYSSLCRTCGGANDGSAGDRAIHVTSTPEPQKDTPTMTTPIPFTWTADAITVVLDGKVTTVQAGTPQYHGLRDCIFREDWAAIGKHVSLTGALQQWLGDKFVVAGEAITCDGAPLPASIAQRIFAMASAGESPGPLFAFYERLSRNPSCRSVEQLWGFLAHMGIPLEPDGTFLAYKGVRENFLDGHSNTINNEPGQVVKMPRNQVYDDPDHTCHRGLHVGAAGYAGTFSARTVIVRIDPENVVCVPNDYSAQKMRVCEYTVVGIWGGGVEGGEFGGEGGVVVDPMPSTTLAVDEDGGEDDADWSGDVEYQDDSMAEGDEQTDRGEKPAKRVVLTSKPTGPRAATFARMNPLKLMEQGIGDLRKYASSHLKIVGASKLPGGKAKLVSAILKARRKKQR